MFFCCWTSPKVIDKWRRCPVSHASNHTCFFRQPAAPLPSPWPVPKHAPAESWGDSCCLNPSRCLTWDPPPTSGRRCWRTRNCAAHSAQRPPPRSPPPLPRLLLFLPARVGRSRSLGRGGEGEGGGSGLAPAADEEDGKWRKKRGGGVILHNDSKCYRWSTHTTQTTRARAWADACAAWREGAGPRDRRGATSRGVANNSRPARGQRARGRGAQPGTTR